MPELICDTSPLQYLHQLGLLRVLPALSDRVLIPPAVAEEISVGQALGVDLPDLATLDWITVQHPVSEAARPLVVNLGASFNVSVGNTRGYCGFG